MRTFWCTALALVAFAANSILCRVALRESLVDPATFSTIRLTTGAATLLLFTRMTQGDIPRAAASWTLGVLLTMYAVPFAFAYASLSVGTGALILFGSVQATMWIAAARMGERPGSAEYFGLAAALAGLLYLVLPGVSAPSPGAAALMAIAGVSWGFYSLLGRGSANPLAQTAGNFLRAVPLVLVVSVATLPRFQLDTRGMWLAVASGVLASGAGYVLWYAALAGLTASRAGIVQLAVAPLTVAAGIVFLGEAVSRRLLLSSVLILGGIGLAIASRQRRSRPRLA